MCEVTRHNFRDLYPEIEKSMKESSFLSVDTLYSGLNPKIKKSIYDTGQERYLKMKDSIKQYVVLQIGISCFKFISDRNEFSCRIYRFHIFTRAFGPFDLRFLIESTSLEFLAENKFDLNKVIYDGISCLHNTQILELRKQLGTSILFNPLERMVDIDDEILLQNLFSGVAKWVVTAKPGDTNLVKFVDDKHSFLMQAEIRRRFTGVWTYTHEEGILVKVLTTEERADLNKDESNRRLEDDTVDILMGFTKVFQLMASLKKPVIGHNFLLDLLMMYSQFCDPLPQSLKSFKRSVNQLFPEVYDTKFMIYELRNTLKIIDFKIISLEDLYNYFKMRENTLEHSPNVKIEPGFYDEVGEKEIIEPGWNAFMTGYCFIKMAHYFAVTLNDIRRRPLTFAEHLAAIEPLRNRMSTVRENTTHLNLEGDDPFSIRPVLLHISGRRKQNLCRLVLTELFAKYGSVEFKPTSPHTVFAIVSTSSSVNDILRDFKESKDFKVESYNLLFHSTIARKAMWTGLVVSVSVCLWFIYNRLKQL